MNGTGETKAAILLRVVDKLDENEKHGCAFGKVLNQKETETKVCLNKMDKTLDKINEKFTWGVIIMVILSFLAGINSVEIFLKTLVR